MRERFVVAKRVGRVQVPFERRLDDSEPPGADGGRVRHGTELRGRIEGSTEWTVHRRGTQTRVTERVSYGRRWYTLALVGLVAFVGAQAATLANQPEIALLTTGLGFGSITLATVVATPMGNLPRQQVSLDSLRYPQLGVLSSLWVPAGVATLTRGPSGLACTGGALTLWLVHGHSEAVETRLASVTTHLSEYAWRLPAVPARYVAAMATAAIALAAFGALNTEITATDPALTLGLFALVSTIVGVGLHTVASETRRRARLVVVGTAALSGLFILSLPLQLTVVVRPLAAASAIDRAALLGAAAVLVGLWVAVWVALFAGRTRTRDEFLDSGREITTRQAAGTAYLMITTAGTFLCVCLGLTGVCWRLLTTGTPPVVWLLGAALALPAAYLLAGSVFQLGRVCRMVWQMRTTTDRNPAHSLPFEPTASVWELPAEEFYGGAYWDPFGRAIVVSTGAFAELDDDEVAALVAHEESHFEHRGAQLQFLFAVLPTVALMGKNVVYSIYDFYEREHTADAYAVRRLDRAQGDDDGEDAVVRLLGRLQREGFEEVTATSLTYLPTLRMTGTEPTADGLNRVFELFHGHFAGLVHPSLHDRIQSVRRGETHGLESLPDDADDTE